MSTTYNISVINTSGKTQSYLLFAVVPKVSSVTGSVFTNVFMTAPPIVSKPNRSSSTTFTITREFFAICGTSIRSLAAGVQVGTSDYESAVLGTNQIPGTTFSFTTVDGAHFILPSPAKTAPNGAYTIATDSSFRIPNPNNTFVGLGGMSTAGSVVPMATFLASPSDTYNIFPVVKYYIATGSYSPGEIINVQEIGVTQLVDFTGSPYNSKTYVQLDNGTYEEIPQLQAKQYKLLRLRSEKAALLGYDEANADEEEGDATPAAGGGPLARELQDVFIKLLNVVEAGAHGGKAVAAKPKAVKGRLVGNGHGNGAAPVEEDVL